MYVALGIPLYVAPGREMALQLPSASYTDIRADEAGIGDVVIISFWRVLSPTMV